MEQMIEQKPAEFVDRRQNLGHGRSDGPERRQFTNSYSQSRPDVAELARAIDQYKLLHRRRFITYDELYNVLSELGYRKTTD